MPKRNPGFPAELEKAIKKRWGEEATQHPLKNWTPEQEAEYQRQKAQLSSETQEKKEEEDYVERGGFSMPQKLFIRTVKRTCPRCREYSFSVRDDLYMNKFNCCSKCYERYSLSFAGKDLLGDKK